MTAVGVKGLFLTSGHSDAQQSRVNTSTNKTTSQVPAVKLRSAICHPQNDGTRKDHKSHCWLILINGSKQTPD